LSEQLCESDCWERGKSLLPGLSRIILSLFDSVSWLRKGLDPVVEGTEQAPQGSWLMKSISAL